MLHYQPIVSLADGRVSHYEALVRLADERDGRLVAPGSFLPAAERYGLIQEIDRMVLGKVVALMGGELAEARRARRREPRRCRSPTAGCSPTSSGNSSATESTRGA